MERRDLDGDEIETRGVVGFCDGTKGRELYGWAWRPDFPDLPVSVELWVDGLLAAEAIASVYRPDLRAAGIGHGRYGWRLPLPSEPEDGAPAATMLVRVKDGEPLPGGTLTLSGAASDERLEDAEMEAFIAAVLGRPPHRAIEKAAEAPPAVNFLLHCPDPVDSKALGAREYSYAFVMKAFVPLLETLGRVHVVSDLAREADALYAEHLARGETSLLLSFAPPHRVVLGLRCPVTPVVAWEFPTIPARVWGDDRRHDWRFVLRQTGRCITLSRFAAAAVRAALGMDFPVAAIPAPVFGRFASRATPADPGLADRMFAGGFLLDTRNRTFDPSVSVPPLPALPTDEEGATAMTLEVALDGVIFVAIVSPTQDQTAWPDLLTAFVEAHREHPDATLVLRMVTDDLPAWWWDVHDVLGRLRAFSCRIVVIHGHAEETKDSALIAAAQWGAGASRADGTGLPLSLFMCEGRPVVSPIHTALLDLVNPSCALVVTSEEVACAFPHDPAGEMSTTCHHVSWPSLVAAFTEARRLTLEDPDRYAAMASAAWETTRRFCSDDIVAAKLDAFLGLGRGLSDGSSPPSPLLGSSIA